MYIHVGCLGPRRIDVDENGYSNSLPVQMKDNENSLLDLTDIVIIDAVGTGYSRPAGDSSLDAFIGYDNDNRTMGDFIRQYINRHNRWGSKKYLAGESYGTTRSVGICKYLSDTYAMDLNGLILISSVNDYSAVVFDEGNEMPYVLFTPTFAADAWYNGMVSQEYQDMELEDYLDEVRSFVENDYIPALFMGNRLTEDEVDAVAEKYAGYTGLSKEYVLEANLRVSMDDFLKDLLKEDKLMVGRYDGRITGPVTSGDISNGDSDPSDAVFDLSYGNAMNNYITTELGYQTDRQYIPMSDDAGNAWTFPIESWGGYLRQENTVYECMSKNSFLNVWVLCGYYDAATPFYSAEYTYSHVFLNDELKDNLSFTYYPCGHMIYMEQNSFDKFRKDAEAWFGKQ
jgi:carboxypeptidase C (cathepsin A)